MVIWINGAFGSGKTTAANELMRRINSADAIIFDPENIGYFMRRNLPAELTRGDFRDIPLWRGINYELLSYIARGFDGVVIAPMTITDPAYFDEIIGQLRRDGVDVRHVILAASRETLLKRLNRRLSHGDTFAKRQIDVCVPAFETVITEGRIETDALTISEVVERIAREVGVELPPDTLSRFGRFVSRKMAQLRVIRWLFKP
ncbi:MAG: AAA family ATPase [Oscillospiraceae bacterium]|jgi:DNA helicase HerA-like ATPase|nr:AAA family ATPase [Oscillospiraceae bacterium]